MKLFFSPTTTRGRREKVNLYLLKSHFLKIENVSIRLYTKLCDLGCCNLMDQTYMYRYFRIEISTVCVYVLIILGDKKQMLMVTATKSTYTFQVL